MMGLHICSGLWWTSTKKSGDRNLQDIEQRRNDLLPEHQMMQKRSQKLQSLQDKKQQCQKNAGTWAEEHGQLRTVIENSNAKDGRSLQQNPGGILGRSGAGSGIQRLAGRR